MQRELRGRTQPYRVSITSRFPVVAADAKRLRQAVRGVLHEAKIHQAQINIAIVDDPTIARLNEQFLQHKGPTDVLTFPLSHSAVRLEGEIVVSADTAARMAPSFGWTTADELLLYVIHGSLHLIGMDDLQASTARKMRAAESRHLAHFGLSPSPVAASKLQNRNTRASTSKS